ncbi:carboxypeptidase-like regulatory domain-containing protein [Niabella hibiscisoli]|nr:carboxypeptidase-like regulatory domain-containing protein [Niabella hibiscisoli]
MVKGKSGGTQTNAQGKFTLTVPANDTSTTLLVEHVGYQAQEITAGNEKLLHIVLAASMSQMEEVVTIGYATVKKKISPDPWFRLAVSN